MTWTVAPARRSADYLKRNCPPAAFGRNLATSMPSSTQCMEDIMADSTDRLLRRTLWGNAVFSAASGVVMAAFAVPLTRLAVQEAGAISGPDFALVLELLGLGLIAFGLACAWIASRPTLPRTWAQVVFAADLVWVVGSLLVLGLPSMWTAIGLAGMVIQALIVADFVVLEYLGLRRLGAQ